MGIALNARNVNMSHVNPSKHSTKWIDLSLVLLGARFQFVAAPLRFGVVVASFSKQCLTVALWKTLEKHRLFFVPFSQ